MLLLWTQAWAKPAAQHPRGFKACKAGRCSKHGWYMWSLRAQSWRAMHQPDALCRETRPCACSRPNAICAGQGSGSSLELPVLSRDQTPNPQSAVTTIEAAAAHSRSRL